MTKHQNIVHVLVLFCACLVWLAILVFGDSWKRKTLNMAKMITKTTTIPIGILVSALCLQQIVFTFKLLFIFSSTMFLILHDLKETLFWYILFYFVNIIFIGHLNQSKHCERNSTKPDVFVIFSQYKVKLSGRNHTSRSMHRS